MTRLGGMRNDVMMIKYGNVFYYIENDKVLRSDFIFT